MKLSWRLPFKNAGLPYSVDEINGIHASGKYHDLKRTYNEFYRIYEAPVPAGKTLRPDVIVTEDSNSGFDSTKPERSDSGTMKNCEKNHEQT